MCHCSSNISPLVSIRPDEGRLRYRVNPGKYGQRCKYGQRATNAHTKASLGCDSKASISPIICTFGYFVDCILLDSVPLKQHNIPVHSDHPYVTVPFCENFKERAGLNQTISLHALWYFG